MTEPRNTGHGSTISVGEHLYEVVALFAYPSTSGLWQWCAYYSGDGFSHNESITRRGFKDEVATLADMAAHGVVASDKWLARNPHLSTYGKLAA